MRLTPAAYEQRLQDRRRLASYEAPGRKVGRGEGGWITDLAELRQSIILCNGCNFKWKWYGARRYGYAVHKKWNHLYGGVTGSCDACREFGNHRQLYVHEIHHGRV